MPLDCVNILIVDDLPENLLVLETVLGELGQNVVTAQGGAEALRQVLDKEFAVILLDVNMPDLDGYETAALIRGRKKSAHTPIIFITAHADAMHAIHGYTLGAVDFILSPVSPAILRTKVKVFVDLFCMTEQVRRQAREQVALAHEQAARSAAEETVWRLNLLAEGSRVLASSLDLEATLRGLLRLVVTGPGELGLVTLRGEDATGSLHSVAGLMRVWFASINAHEGLRVRALAGPNALPGDFADAVERVIAQGKPAFQFDVGAEGAPVQFWNAFLAKNRYGTPLASLQTTALLPLVARGRTLGVLAVAMVQNGRWRNPADLALLEDLAHRAAIAIDNAQLYRGIQQQDHRKNEFLSILAHELRNPLVPLLNGIQILRQSESGSAESQRVKDMMDRQLHHLIRLVDDLLDISRITRDKIQLQIEPVDIDLLVHRAIEVSQPILDQRAHELSVALPVVPVRVMADAVRLAQVLSNLLNNAAKYTEPGGKVALQVDRRDDEIVFRVKDNGIGIPSDMLSGIFEPFTQVRRKTDSHEQTGLGIGLTLVRRLVEMHGGTVQAFSAGLNQGSEFVVRLPSCVEGHEVKIGGRAEFRKGPVECPPIKPVPYGIRLADARPSSHRVLIVDDNADVTESTAMLLGQLGLQVQVASNGLAALALVDSFQPDIVFLDLGLPAMDGYEVARRIREEAGQQPLLVALTGYGREEDRQRSQVAGFDHHLVKPATLADLAALLSRLDASPPVHWTPTLPLL